MENKHSMNIEYPRIQASASRSTFPLHQLDAISTSACHIITTQLHFSPNAAVAAATTG
jgi:hypothetical protein